jgi:hypothetical protein
MSTDILNQPWQIQAALACGYLAYMVSYTGIRVHHRAIEIAFISLVFSLGATLAIFLLSSRGPVWSVIGALVVCVSAGIAWRALGRDWYRQLMRVTDLSWSDDDPSALATIVGNSQHPVTQVAVLLDDGTWLRCDDTRRFDDAPYAPCLIGPNGDVALYLTHEEADGCAPKEMTTVIDPNYGTRLTYIPATRIRRLTVRHMHS